MSIEHFALGLLSVLLLGSNVFWAKLVIAMSNRIMSRNYYEFAQSEKLKAQKPAAKSEREPEQTDPEDERQARELNAIMGIA